MNICVIAMKDVKMMHHFNDYIPNIDKQHYENFDDYRFRLYYNKDEYGLSNEQIGQLLNDVSGNNYDESSYRKKAHAEIDMYERMYPVIYEQVAAEFDVQVNPKAYQDVQNEFILKRERTEQRIRDQRNRLNDTVRKEARSDNITATIQRSARLLANSDNRLKFNYEPPQPSKTGTTAVLQLSDWHIGSKIDNFIGQYDTQVASKWLEEITYETISYCKSMNVNELIVLNQGDLVSGDIHITTRVENDEDIVEQILVVVEILKNMLLEFSKHIPNVQFITVTDNHARANKSYSENIEKENYQNLIPGFLNIAFENIDNVEIIKNKINGIDECEIGKFKIFDEDILVVHGHNDRLPSMISDLSMFTRTFPIAIFTAHIHKNYEDESNEIDLICNPPLATTDSYAKKKRLSSKPGQKISIFANDKGYVYRRDTRVLRPTRER